MKKKRVRMPQLIFFDYAWDKRRFAMSERSRVAAGCRSYRGMHDAGGYVVRQTHYYALLKGAGLNARF